MTGIVMEPSSSISYFPPWLRVFAGPRRRCLRRQSNPLVGVIECEYPTFYLTASLLLPGSLG